MSQNAALPAAAATATPDGPPLTSLVTSVLYETIGAGPPPNSGGDYLDCVIDAQPTPPARLVAPPARTLPNTSSAWRRVLRRLNRTIHTGEVAGFFGQGVALLVCLTALLLVVTGLSLSVRRFFAARKRSMASAPVLAPSVDTGKP